MGRKRGWEGRGNNIVTMEMNTLSLSDSPEPVQTAESHYTDRYLLGTAIQILWTHRPVCTTCKKRGGQKQASLKVLKSGGPSFGA